MLKKCIAQNFKILFEIFKFYYDFSMNIMKIKMKNVQSIFRKKNTYGTYTAHHEPQDILRIHWYSTGPTIYNWNTMFQYGYAMLLGSRTGENS